MVHGPDGNNTLQLTVDDQGMVVRANLQHQAGATYEL